jgi:hypothetical protein
MIKSEALRFTGVIKHDASAMVGDDGKPNGTIIGR